LRLALKPLAKKIQAAFVYGSLAASSAKAQSDVDLMVIGSCDFGEVVDAVGKAQEQIGREVHPSVYPADEFRKKLKSGHLFLKTVMAGEKIFLIGDADELARLV
jgi:predicted nucleotidyltransferase